MHKKIEIAPSIDTGGKKDRSDGGLLVVLHSHGLSNADSHTDERILTLEALEDVDAGRVVDHNTVQNWVGHL